MKSAIICSLLVLIVFVSNAQTQTNRFTVGDNRSLLSTTLSFEVKVVPGNENKFLLQVNNPQKKKLQLWIRHNDLGTVVDKPIFDEWFNCNYNMESASDGKYTIMVSCGKERITKEIELLTTTTVVRNIVVQ